MTAADAPTPHQEKAPTREWLLKRCEWYQVELDRLKAQAPDGWQDIAKCRWTEDDEGIWDTACGQKWVFTEGYPWDNKARFCFACGHRIEAVRFVEPTDADDDAALPDGGQGVRD